MAGYLGIDWPWLQDLCQQFAQEGTAALLRPCSRQISAAGPTRRARTLARLARAWP